jgi:hypothetical protein
MITLSDAKAKFCFGKQGCLGHPSNAGVWQGFSKRGVVNNEQAERRAENHRKTIASMEKVCAIKVDAIVSLDQSFAGFTF